MANKKFKPTAQEAVGIAFEDLSYQQEKLTEYALRLDIRNIRILNKIKHYAELLEPLLKGYQPGLVASALHSLVLYTWCFYGHGKNKPDLDYVVNIGFGSALFKDKDKLSKQHKRWNAMLADYGYRDTSPLDHLIAQGVKRGYFENPRWGKTADEYNQQFIQNDFNTALNQAWSLFNDTFADNQAEFVEALYRLCTENIEKLSVRELHSSVVILRELNEAEKADALIDAYVTEFNAVEHSARFDLEELNHFGDLIDAALLEKFKAHFDLLAPNESVEQILDRIAKTNGWSTKDITLLANMTADEYETLFRNKNGDQLYCWISKLLGFGRFTNPDEQHKQIYNRTVEALKRIAQDSDYNKLRMKKFKLNLYD